MEKNSIEFSAPLLLVFVLLFTPEAAYAGEKVILPDSISINVRMISGRGGLLRQEKIGSKEIKVGLILTPSGYMFHSTICPKGDMKIENREVEKLLELIFIRADRKEKSTCCDRDYTRTVINLNYSSPTSQKKITAVDDHEINKIISNLCQSAKVSFNPPDDPESQLWLGKQWFEVGLYESAAEALERAVKLDPEHVAVETHEVLGDTYRRLYNNEKALEAYKRALGLRPESAKIFSKLGSVYSESGRKPEAIEAYKQALRFAPDGDAALEAQEKLAYRYEEQGRFVDAAKAYEEVLHAKPDDASTRFSLGKIYLELGDINSALAQHKILKDLKSTYADDLYLRIYQHAVRQNPDDPDAHFNLGNAHYWAKQYAKAIDPYKQAIRLKPDLELAYARLGTSYAELDQYEPAIEAYEAAIRLKPQEAINRVDAGLMYFYVDKKAQAIAHLKEAIRLKPDLAAAHNNLGYVLRSTGADREAIMSLKEAIRLDPDDEFAPYNLGVAYQNLGEYKAAVEAYKKAIVLKPKYIDARFQLGSAYYWMGNHVAALKAYDDLKIWNRRRADELYSLIRNPIPH